MRIQRMLIHDLTGNSLLKLLVSLYDSRQLTSVKHKGGLSRPIKTFLIRPLPQSSIRHQSFYMSLRQRVLRSFLAAFPPPGLPPISTYIAQEAIMLADSSLDFQPTHRDALSVKLAFSTALTDLGIV